jgi:hypothetical protein
LQRRLAKIYRRDDERRIVGLVPEILNLFSIVFAIKGQVDADFTSGIFFEKGKKCLPVLSTTDESRVL